MSDIIDLVVDPDQLRPMMDMRFEHDAAEDSELLSSIREHGIKDALTCRYTKEELPDGRPIYEIVDGRRRYRMGLEAGVLKFRITAESMNDIQAFAIAFMKNDQRQNMTDAEKAMWIQTMMERFELTQVKISELLGRHKSWVSRQLQLVRVVKDLPPEQKNLVKTEYQARALEKLSPERKTEILAEATSKGVLPSARELERLAKATKDPKEVLQKWKYQDDEYIRYCLMEECGLTLTEAGNMVKNFRLKKLPWQQRKKDIDMNTVIRPPDGDPKAEMYRKLGEWYPVNLLDMMGLVAPAKTLPTWQQNCRRAIRLLLERTPANVKTLIQEEFMV
jgi:ParB/RepB/Spo0J family partition protein